MENQKRRKTMMNINTNWGLPLPHHMAPHIFSKLPISNLPPCRCVCKSWNHLVLDYARNPFSKSHLPNSIIISSRDCDPDSPSGFLNPKIHCFDINTLSCVASCTLVQPIPNKFIALHDCCNGLLYITKLWSTIDGCEPGIFNPMTHEFFSIPDFRDSVGFFQGFGFSIKTKQYKIFKVYPNPRGELKVLRLGNHPYHNQWTSIYFSSPINIRSHGAYMNGVIYWIGIEKNNKKFKVKSIYALDVETEKFEEIALDVGPYGYRGTVQLFNDTIYAIIYVTKPINQIQFWKMQSKNSWIKDFIIPGKCHNLDLFLLKAFEDGKLLVKINNSLFWLKYGRRIQMKDKIKILIPCTRQYTYFHFCKLDSLHFGSLFSILGGNG